MDRPPHLAWREFQSSWKWAQGEHVTLLGPTGCGKTTLATSILDRRDWVVAFGTKRRDPSLSYLKGQGFKIIRDWPPNLGERKVILWPRVDRPSDIADQRRIFGECLDDVYSTGGWCLYIDELRYLTDFLALSGEVELILQQGRSLDVSVIATTQRPRKVPVAIYDQATHLFLWRDNDAYNLRRLGEIGAGFDSRALGEIVASLDIHKTLWIDTRRGTIRTTQVDL